MTPEDSLLNRLNMDLDILQEADLRADLESYINHLLLEDFNGLLQLLYRVDINEQKLKEELTERKGEDAAAIISDLLIMRSREKEEARRKNTTPPATDIPADEAW